MTPREALLDLVARVGARDGAAVRISETDVRQWPAEAVAALTAHRLLVRARPARTVVCPGCEADCVMPVQTIPAGSRAAARFIVCDKRSDINRVALTTAHVDHWKCDGEALARFVVEQVGLRRSRHRADDSGTRPLGLAAGDTRHQMLGLRTHGDVTLVVADTAVALADLIDFERGAYVLDTAAIRHLVDAATTADPRYTPSTTRREARTLDSQARYRTLATGLPRAEAAAPADVRHVVRPTDCQAGGGGWLPRGHYPQTHDGKVGDRHAARLTRRKQGGWDAQAAEAPRTELIMGLPGQIRMHRVELRVQHCQSASWGSVTIRATTPRAIGPHRPGVTVDADQPKWLLSEGAEPNIAA